MLQFTLGATDTDVPAQRLTFSLDPGAAAGATVSTNGLFSWTPIYAPATNSFTVRVTDDGVPPASTTGTFKVVVGVLPRFTGGSSLVSGNQVTFGFQATPGAVYQVQYKNRLGDTNWTNLEDVRTADGPTLTFVDDLRNQSSRYYRVIVK
jgi:hypothetical protein